MSRLRRFASQIRMTIRRRASRAKPRSTATYNNGPRAASGAA
ncbi:hypothetical protein FTUN_5745 [Frigoriglobus tundricola]|uniref:Uncharacterized protein n=1 Tax=Frigoriglobus tundricola TaxID=2774151 RepID=A0A6M5YVW3_9BACT|nr:hypothetical protein FTUN_5745 [Frigoriglobus tundricola]